MTGPFGRRAPLLWSLKEGLKGNPLEVLTKIFLANHSSRTGRVTPKRMVNILLHENIKVSTLNFSILSSFFFFRS